MTTEDIPQLHCRECGYHSCKCEHSIISLPTPKVSKAIDEFVMTTTNLDELAGKLERADWPSVAEDVRDGIPLQVIANRLVSIGEGDSEAYELVTLADDE